jgi:hypothetical protein
VGDLLEGEHTSVIPLDAEEIKKRTPQLFQLRDLAVSLAQTVACFVGLPATSLFLLWEFSVLRRSDISGEQAIQLLISEMPALLYIVPWNVFLKVTS